MWLLRVSIDFLCSPTLPHFNQDILARTLGILLLTLAKNGILLVVDIEKVHHSLCPPPGTPAYGQVFLRGGKKVKGYGSREIAAACLELEFDDIQVMEGVNIPGKTAMGREGGGKRRSCGLC